MKKVLANSFLLMFLFGMLVAPVASVGLLKIQTGNQEVLSSQSEMNAEEDIKNQIKYYKSLEETTQSTQTIN